MMEDAAGWVMQVSGVFFFSSRRRHTRYWRDWSSDVCSSDLEATADGADGVLAGLRPGTVWADISTIAPDASVALAERVRETGAAFLDCPVSGSPATLAAGQMSVMVGGDREAFDHVEEVLHAIGPKVTYIGPNGQAILTKVAINLALVVSVTAFAEGIALVEKAGVDRAAVVDAVLKSVIASPVVRYRAPLPVDDTDVLADVELQQKDLVLAQDLARKLGAAVPTCAATSEMLNAGRASSTADQIGRASCRERVQISVDAVSL